MTESRNHRKNDIDLVPAEGLEPSRHRWQQILSLPCMPFHHAGGESFLLWGKYSVKAYHPSRRLRGTSLGHRMDREAIPMDHYLSWGLGVVRGAQSLSSPALTIIMKGLSLAGTEFFFLAFLPLIYWCIDKRRGLRIGILVFLSAAINMRLKLAFAQPRPYDLEPALGMAKESSYGLPSGHAQASAVFAGSTAPLFSPPWGMVFAIALPFLVGISRIYLGVHFPTDVFAGWAIGAAIIGLDRLAGDRLERFFAGLHDTLAIALVAAIALAMNVLNIKDTSLSGAFFGLVAAAIYAKKSAPFSISGSLLKRALRYLFGIATVAIVYALPKLFLAGIEAGGPPLLRFLRYALLGAWVAAGAPWLFLKMGLADPEP
jgi:membrane-associated phospholipid phosphatase